LERPYFQLVTRDELTARGLRVKWTPKSRPLNPFS
jgi:hypothetical protein